MHSHPAIWHVGDWTVQYFRLPYMQYVCPCWLFGRHARVSFVLLTCALSPLHAYTYVHIESPYFFFFLGFSEIQSLWDLFFPVFYLILYETKIASRLDVCCCCCQSVDSQWTANSPVAVTIALRCRSSLLVSYFNVFLLFLRNNKRSTLLTAVGNRKKEKKPEQTNERVHSRKCFSTNQRYLEKMCVIISITDVGIFPPEKKRKLRLRVDANAWSEFDRVQINFVLAAAATNFLSECMRHHTQRIQSFFSAYQIINLSLREFKSCCPACPRWNKSENNGPPPWSEIIKKRGHKKEKKFLYGAVIHQS